MGQMHLFSDPPAPTPAMQASASVSPPHPVTPSPPRRRRRLPSIDKRPGLCLGCGENVVHCTCEAFNGGASPAMKAVMSEVKMPDSHEKWQNVIDAAHGALVLDAARQYGLVTGGPVVNVERCLFYLAEGRKMGMSPSPRAVEEFVESVQAKASKAAGRKGKS